jgi:putative ABC transport system permease protein
MERLLTLGSPLPPVALRNVVHGGTRTLAALAGVGFVVTMVLLQLGFLQAVRDTATNLYDRLDFDVALVSPQYQQLYDAGTLPQERLREAERVASVTEARPLYAIFRMWRCPPVPLDPAAATRPGWLAGRRRPVRRRELLAIGIDLDRNPFLEPIRSRIDGSIDRLRLDDRVLLNERSHPDFGWWAWPAFDGWELGPHRVEVVGGFPLERGFGADGSVLCSEPNYLRLCAPPFARGMSLGLLRVKPGTVAETVRTLNATLPPDSLALSREELARRERDFWVNQTSTGNIFAAGVFVAMAVAAVVVYQVLSNDVRSHLPEYATLKAMGHSNGFLTRVVVTQALFYALGAYVPAVVLSFAAYRATEALANIPMRFTAANLAEALGLAVVVSLGSALLTVGKLRSADPAELY